MCLCLFLNLPISLLFEVINKSLYSPVSTYLSHSEQPILINKSLYSPVSTYSSHSEQSILIALFQHPRIN